MHTLSAQFFARHAHRFFNLSLFPAAPAAIFLRHFSLASMDNHKLMAAVSDVVISWVGAQNLKKPEDSRHQRPNLRKSLQPTAIV